MRLIKPSFSIWDQQDGTVYLKISYGTMDDRGEFSNEPIVIKYIDNPYSVVMNNSENDYWYITSNYRVIIENEWIDDLQYLCEPTEFHSSSKRTGTFITHGVFGKKLFGGFI